MTSSNIKNTFYVSLNRVAAKYTFIKVRNKKHTLACILEKQHEAFINTKGQAITRFWLTFLNAYCCAFFADFINLSIIYAIYYVFENLLQIFGCIVFFLQINAKCSIYLYMAIKEWYSTIVEVEISRFTNSSVFSRSCLECSLSDN